MSDAEAMLDVATGGVIARAVEPEASNADMRGASDADMPGAGDAGAGHGAVCLNCGAGLVGAHCHQCGQPAHVHRTLTAFWHDLLHGVLHFEGKVWRTLPMLGWRPGELTRRYVAGERARFVSPLALFLFCVFTMFAVISLTGGPVLLTDKDSGVELQKSLGDSIARADADVAKVEAERVAAIAARQPLDTIDARLKEARDSVSMLRMMKQRGIVETGIVRASDDLPGAPGWIRKGYKKAKANPSLLLYKLQNNAYKYSWALIPISVPFVWLLFPFSRSFRVYDHAVFVTYSLCFMTLLMVALSLIKAGGGATGVTTTALTFVPPVHMYRQLRGAYRLGRLSALLRTLLLLVFASVAATLFMLLLLGLGVLG